MATIQTVDIETFNNDYESVNKATLDKARHYYYSKVKSLLSGSGFSDDMLEEMAVGIVDKGEELMINAVEESHEYNEIDEVNDISYMCQTMHNLSILWLTIDGKKEHEKEKEEIAQVLPEPESEYYMFNEEANNLQKCLQELKDFIHNMSRRSFSCCMVILGKFDIKNEEIQFGDDSESGPVVPLTVIENQVWKMMAESENILPEACHLVFQQPKRSVFISSQERKTGRCNPKRYLLEGKRK